MSSQAKRKSIFRASGYSWGAFGILWLVFALNANARELVGRVLPAIVDEYHLSANFSGNFLAVIFTSMAFLTIPIGHLSDRKGTGYKRKYFQIWTLAIYTCFNIIMGFQFLSATVWLILAFMVVKSLVLGPDETIIVTQVGEWWPREYRGFAIGAHHTGYPWGSLLGGIAVSALLATFGAENWRYGFLALGIIAIPVAIIYWLFFNKKNFTKVAEHAAKNDLSMAVDDPNGGVEEKPGALKRSFKNPNIIVPAIVCFAVTFIYYGNSLLLSPYLVYVAGYDYSQAALYSVLFTITAGLGQLFWGAASDKVGRKFCLLITTLWLAVGVFLLQYVSISFTFLIGIQLFMGFGTNSNYVMALTLGGESAEKGAMGKGIGIVEVGLYLGGVSPAILGVLVTAGGGWESISGYVFSFRLMAVVMILAFIAVLLFSRETQGWFKRHDKALVKRSSCNIEEPEAAQ
jgi:MFS family permease